MAKQETLSTIQNLLVSEANKFRDKVMLEKIDEARLGRIIQNLTGIAFNLPKERSAAFKKIKHDLDQEMATAKSNPAGYNFNRHIALRQAHNTLKDNAQ